jgi:hypothetical protein
MGVSARRTHAIGSTATARPTGRITLIDVGGRNQACRNASDDNGVADGPLGAQYADDQKGEHDLDRRHP